MKNIDPLIDIRSIQHFLYCSHRWGLLEIACEWTENAFISKAKLVHERVDTAKVSLSRGSFCERSVAVFDDEWGLFGVLDCLQISPAKDGCHLPKYEGSFALTVVEYKPTAPKSGGFRREDAMQLLAQKICVDSLFHTECSASFYYADTRKRVDVSFCEEDYAFLGDTLKEMRLYFAKNQIPPIHKGQNCSGCSMKDICLPKQGECN